MKLYTMDNARNDRLQLCMRADLALADSIRIPKSRREENFSRNAEPCKNLALVTGGTGFLGRYLIRELLLQSNLHLVCLVRADTDKLAEQRLFDILLSIDVPVQQLETQIQVLSGDIESSGFDLAPERYHKLANNINLVYHAAARVNWVRRYGSLRSANVLGTLEVIKFACTFSVKPVVFVSSIAVCYATSLHGTVDEDCKLISHVSNMPLGYAQTKCIAEGMLQRVASRGLPIRIVRPALISGDSSTGHSSTTDLTAAVMDGCVSSKLAGDIDWPMDHVSVDFVASVIARLPLHDRESKTKTPDILHLCHEHPINWREIVLMLNLYGYPIELVPMEQWLQTVPGNPSLCGARLYAYRHFFLQAQQSGSTKRIYELYAHSEQLTVTSAKSERWLRANKLRAPKNDARSLRATIEFLQQENVLPVLPQSIHNTSLIPSTNGQLATLIQAYIRTKNVSVISIDSLPGNWQNSIFSELLTVRHSNVVGLVAKRALIENTKANNIRHFDCVLKSRIDDNSLAKTCSQVAKLCSPKLGELVNTFSHLLNLHGGAAREQALYELRIPELRHYTPRSLGTINNGVNAPSLVLEFVHAASIKSTQNPSMTWPMTDIDCVLEGLADIQSIPICAIQAEIERDLLKPMHTRAQMLTMIPLWRELLKFSEPFIKEFDRSLTDVQFHLLDTLPHWWASCDVQSQVLVHNDFNPRNLFLRERNRTKRLCVYDWELAALGSPQHDLVEFLCFSLNPATITKNELHRIIENQRIRLHVRGLSDTNPVAWQAGFAQALRHFMITRLPWYCLMHRYKTQLPHPTWLLNTRFPQPYPTAPLSTTCSSRTSSFLKFPSQISR